MPTLLILAMLCSCLGIGRPARLYAAERNQPALGTGKPGGEALAPSTRSDVLERVLVKRRLESLSSTTLVKFLAQAARGPLAHADLGRTWAPRALAHRSGQVIALLHARASRAPPTR